MSKIVLVVDDDPVSVQLLEIVLKRSGYEVVVARSGTIGLQLIADVHPQVVLLDDMMPSMTGGEMCRQIKNSPEFQHIPVILISAGTRVQDPAYVAEVGADDALLKPILPKDVLKAVEKVLGKSG